jgi:hypothetical protein
MSKGIFGKNLMSLYQSYMRKTYQKHVASPANKTCIRAENMFETLIEDIYKKTGRGGNINVKDLKCSRR